LDRGRAHLDDESKVLLVVGTELDIELDVEIDVELLFNELDVTWLLEDELESKELEDVAWLLEDELERMKVEEVLEDDSVRESEDEIANS